MMMMSRLRKWLLIAAMFVFTATVATTSYAAEDVTALYTRMQNTTWAPESIACLKNDPNVVNDVTVAYMKASGSGQYAVKKFVGASGRYFSNGKKSDEIAEMEPGFGFNINHDNDISSLYLGADNRSDYVAIKIGSAGYWVICPYTNEVIVPGSPGATDEYVTSVDGVTAAAGKYAKEHGCVAALAYYNPGMATVIDELFVAYNIDAGNEMFNSGKTEKQKQMEENAKREKEEAQAAAARDAVSGVNSAISSKLAKYIFSKAEIDRLSSEGYVKSVAYLQQGPNGKYGFGVSGSYSTAYRNTSAGYVYANIQELSYNKNTFCALKFNMELPEAADVWYIFNFASDEEALNDNQKNGRSYDMTLIPCMRTICNEVGQINQEYEKNTGEAEREYESETGVIESQGADPNIALYSQKLEIGDVLTEDPLEMVSEVDFNDNSEEMVELKSTVSSFYRLLQIAATCGLLLSLGSFALTLIVYGPKKSHEAANTVALKVLIAVVIFGFADLWALFYPIITSLM